MAPNNSDHNDELRRRESAKAQEANNNTDTSQNDTNAGEEGGEAGQKVVNYLELIAVATYSCITLKDCIKKSLRYFCFCAFQRLPYPKSIGFIVGNEFCERFSFYGMKGK